jgi:hypothetical protein
MDTPDPVTPEAQVAYRRWIDSLTPEQVNRIQRAVFPESCGHDSENHYYCPQCLSESRTR